jgi:ADP-heptose:LPS heptosyltransferase/tetratricopeptide (TPR) repeat protein
MLWKRPSPVKGSPRVIRRHAGPAYKLLQGVLLGSAVIEEADAARDQGRWADAAQKYRRATIEWPARADLKVQLGNCLKEAGAFRQSFDAYTAARARDNSAEPVHQIGHLMKVTGNFHAMEISYRIAAAQGHEAAQLELRNLDDLSVDVVRVPASKSTLSKISLEVFRDIFACELTLRLDPLRLRKAGLALAALNEGAIARGFFQLALLVSPPATAQDEQVEIVLRYPDLWPVGHVAELLQTAAPSEIDADPRSSLERLAILALDRDTPTCNTTEVAQPPKKIPNVEDIQLITEDRSDVELPLLCEALDGVYQHTVLKGLVAAPQRAPGRLVADPIFISVFEDCSRRELRVAACRVLYNCVNQWLRVANVWSCTTNEYPELIQYLAQTKGNPLAARIAELGSSDAVLHELSAFLNGASARGTRVGETKTAIDRAIGRIVTICLSELPTNTALQLFEAAIVRHFDVTAAAIAEKLVSLRNLTDNEIIKLAQGLKHFGQPQAALELLKHCFDEQTISTAALVEKGIIAKVCGDFALAARSFERCAAREPDNEFVRGELIAVLPEIEDPADSLSRLGNDGLFTKLARERFAFRRALMRSAQDAGDLAFSDGVRLNDLAPELVGEFINRRAVENPRETIRIVNAGWLKRRALTGTLPLLRACEFVRAEVISGTPLVGMRVRVDGRSVGWAEPSPLSTSASNVLQRTIFNCWMDLSHISPGEHELQLYIEERGGGYKTTEQFVWIDPGPRPQDEFNSPATVVLLAETQGLSIEERVNRLPSVVFNAKRQLFDSPIWKILVMRADQLGDAVASLPAILRLKELFTGATLSCLTSAANRDFFSAANIFEEIFEVATDYDIETRQRRISPVEQARLAKILPTRAFDLAIDLSLHPSTRPLLRLAKARYTAGFGCHRFPWLTVGIDLQTHERVNGHQYMPHAAIPLALVETLASMAFHDAIVLSHPRIDRKVLQPFGLDDGRPFILLHGGARTASRKWPIKNFVELARLIVEKSDLHTVFLVDEKSDLACVTQDKMPKGNFQTVVGRLDFAALDGLLSHCAVFVGNDTGLKHLAALRGVPIVSLHMGAVNWNEWGQDGSGVIITRRVPCYGCGIEAIEECGKNLACLVNITPEEVLREVLTLLPQEWVVVGPECRVT